MTRENRWPDGRIPVLLSAHAGDLLADDARAVLGYLDHDPAATVADVAGHLSTTRRVRRHRTVVRAGDRDELADGLRAVAEGAEHSLVARSAEGSPSRIAFVFPGQGTQWPSMGTQAYQELPQYRVAADACAEAFTAAGAASPMRYLTTPGTAEGFSETEIEGAQFTHAVALAHVWRSYKVLPDITVGHSLGEIGAAYLAGAITLADAVAVVIARAEVVDRLPGDHAVAVLGVDPDTAQQVIAATPGWVELSVVNAATSVAVSGDRHAVSAAVALVREQGRFAREITVGFPVHTSILEPRRDDFVKRLPQAVFADTPVQFIGGATGDVVPAGTTFGDYWYANLRTMVRFDHAFESARRCGATTFVELSAHPQLVSAMGDLLGDTTATLVGSGRRDAPITEALSGNLAVAAVSDPGHGWRDAVERTAHRLRGFPNAPMRATPLWALPEPLSETADITVAQEVWQPIGEVTPSAHTAPVTVAVLELGATGPLGERLRAAVDAHPGTALGTADAADVMVVVAPQPGSADAGTAVAAVTDLVGSGMLRYPALAGPRCRDIWLVTPGGEQVGPGEPQALSAAAIAAMHRSLGLENPEIGFHHLDLPADPQVDTAVVDTLLTGAGEVAIRHADGPVLYRRTGADAPVTAPWSLDSGILDDVVITGGAGRIGLHYARHLAERGARRIVLLSRRAVDPALLAELTARRGTEVVSLPCDLTDRESIRAATEFASPGASLLIHAAGAATFATGDRLDAAAAANTLGAKVAGLAHLADLWPLRRDARIILCSSVSGLWGGHGHAVYSAANRMLDAMAERLRADGHRCVSVRWGLWQSGSGEGIVDAAETARIERSGLRPMVPQPAIEASLCDHTVDPLVFSVDPHRMQMFSAATERVRGPQTPETTAAPLDTAEVVRAELAAVLKITDPGGIDLDASLFDLGVDSLLALDLRKRFRRVLGRTVPLATLLGGVTGAELVAELDEKVENPRD